MTCEYFQERISGGEVSEMKRNIWMNGKEKIMKLLKSLFSSSRMILSFVVVALLILSGLFVISVDRSAEESTVIQTPTSHCNFGVCKKK